jgi:transposase
LLNGLWGDLQGLDQRVHELDQAIKVIADSDVDAKRLQQLRGVGPMIATALVAAVGKGEHFTRGRQMSASLGLTPRQHSSGNKDRLLGISKRGDPYLRSLLVHGARATIWAARNKDDRLSRWVKDLAARRHPNIAAVALANKTVRMAWAMLHNGTDYQPDLAMAE